MSTPQADGQTTPKEHQQQDQYRTLTRNLSFGLLILCPAIALLPPRKFDLYTFGLGGVWFASANHLAKDRTGRSILQRVSGSGRSLELRELPSDRADELQRQLREARTQGSQKVYMGGERDKWREERARREKEILERGEGYGDLITEQVWDVWNQGKKDNETKGVDSQEKENR